MRLPARLAAPVLAVSLLVLAGCGDGEATDEGAAASSPTSSTSDEADPAGSTETAEAVSVDAFVQRLKAGMGERGSVHVAMRMSGPVETSAEGDTTYGPDGSEMRMTMSMPQLGGQGEIEMVVADGNAYMSMPGFTEPGQFFKISEDNPAAQGLTGGTGSMSPADSFAGIEAGLQEVEELGSQQVDGETLDRYRLTVDAAAAMKAMGMGKVSGLPETLVYEMWLDGEDRMRRLTYEVQATKIVMDMSEWGQDIEITAPTDLVDAPPTM